MTASFLAAALAAALSVLPSAALPDAPRPSVFADAEVVTANVADAPHRGIGGRLTAGLQGRSLRLFALAEYQGPLGTARVQPRFDGLFLMGPGVGYVPRPWAAGHGALLVGGYGISVRDHLAGEWVGARNAAFGARIGATLTPARVGSRFTLSPALGVAFTALWVQRTTDPVRRVSWGGFTPMLTLSVGAEAQSPPISPAWL